VRSGSRELLDEIAARPEVDRVTANHDLRAVDFDSRPDRRGEAREVEPNLLFVGAPAAWALGATGTGIVVAVNDTGLDEDHPAIASHYRGCLDPPSCTVKDHDHSLTVTVTVPGSYIRCFVVLSVRRRLGVKRAESGASVH